MSGLPVFRTPRKVQFHRYNSITVHRNEKLYSFELVGIVSGLRSEAELQSDYEDDTTHPFTHEGVSAPVHCLLSTADSTVQRRGVAFGARRTRITISVCARRLLAHMGQRSTGSHSSGRGFHGGFFQRGDGRAGVGGCRFHPRLRRVIRGDASLKRIRDGLSHRLGRFRFTCPLQRLSRRVSPDLA